MGNYRDQVSRRECLAAALIWSAIPALSIGFFLLYAPDLPPGGWGYSALLLLLQLLAAAVHWRRWLAYDKTSKIDDHNEEESPHER